MFRGLFLLPSSGETIQSDHLYVFDKADLNLGMEFAGVDTRLEAGTSQIRTRSANHSASTCCMVG
jgi:hypothetical protein